MIRRANSVSPRVGLGLTRIRPGMYRVGSEARQRWTMKTAPARSTVPRRNAPRPGCKKLVFIPAAKPDVWLDLLTDKAGRLVWSKAIYVPQGRPAAGVGGQMPSVQRLDSF